MPAAARMSGVMVTSDCAVAGGTAQVLEYPGNETALELDTPELASTEDAGSDSGPAKGE